MPWLDGDRLTMVKVRRIGEFKGAKYVEAYRDRPGIYPSPAVIQPGKPLVVCEGELDALLLGQALGDLAPVVTLGSASAAPRPPPSGRCWPQLDGTSQLMLMELETRPPPGGLRRAVRVRPPVGKDWTDANQYGVELGHSGVNLRRWWTDRLGGIEAPELFTWDELSIWRWDRRRWDPDVQAERLAIQELG